jgi:DNA helicase-2/ATP-dependent DNA helicase PcrA
MPLVLKIAQKFIIGILLKTDDMKFIADLHVHSRYSRATAKNLDLENLYIAAQLKGVTVVGTGDFTYPAWFAEISEKLVAAEPGLFQLKEELARHCDAQVPESCRRPVRFVLVTEISNIYKKDGKTRKNHNLVFVPDLETAGQFSERLDKIGNIKSDGRPILGLDARDLLEILLETSETAFLIPAHIWTPWFSMLGSKSGFNSIAECFEDLTPHIFAVETGLSSDPAMNWRVSSLDGLTLVSNSDAHSPLNLGREANLFNTQLSYPAIKAALKTADPDQFLGTFEFYPEQGKYHADGHRGCNVSFWPETTLKHAGRCPACGKPLTLGVLYRVEELADRKAGQIPAHRAPYYSIIQLEHILAEILQVGPGSKKIQQAYQSALNKLGSEFNILHHLEAEAIEQAGIPLLAEAVRRMRRGEIDVFPGYDGEYGRVRIFRDHERELLMGQRSLFKVSVPESPAAATRIKNSRDLSAPHPAFLKKAPPDKDRPAPADFYRSHLKNRILVQDRGGAEFRTAGILEYVEDLKRGANKDIGIKDIFEMASSQLSDRQRLAVEHADGPLLIVAGPGTGKTRTLTMRIAYLITKKQVSPANILAVTFTRKAAREMQQRLRAILGEGCRLPLVATFHSLCFNILTELDPEKTESVVDEDERKVLLREAVKQVRNQGNRVAQKAQTLLDGIVAAKQQILDPEDLTQGDNVTLEAQALAEVYHRYQRLLSAQGLNDYEDLIFKVVRLLESDDKVAQRYRGRFRHVFVDEYQDINHGQYRIVRALAPGESSNRNLCVIGDPDQSIYGFRGSDAGYFTRFTDDYPAAAVIRLTRNYRSTTAIVDAAFQVIKKWRQHPGDARTYSQTDGVKTISILELAGAKTEARAIARVIAQMVGGTGFHSIDTGEVADANLVSARSYREFAVLVRTHDQLRLIGEVFEQEGTPFQIASRQNAVKSRGVPELISALKMLEGCGSDSDFLQGLSVIGVGLGKKAITHFKSWCVAQKLSLQQGLLRARRFPIAGLSRTQQQKISDFEDKLVLMRNESLPMTVAEKLKFLAQMPQLGAVVNTDFQSREAAGNLFALAEDFGNDAAGFLAGAALHTDTDAYLPAAEKVALMTMHAAKGLEFPVVFIAGCEDGLIPLNRGGTEPSDIAEERRLFYVAMTRAMEQLYLTRAKKRTIYGKLLNRSLSPFVADIEARLKSDQSPPSETPKKKKSEQHQLKLF